MENKANLPNELLHLIAEGTADGIGVACGLFVQQNRIPVRPTSKSKNPIDDFIILLMKDYESDKTSYPFEEQSIKEELDAIVSEHLLGIEMVYMDKQLDLVKKLVRYVVCGQTLEFLNPKVDKVRELYERIRTMGLVDLPSHGVNQ